MLQYRQQNQQSFSTVEAVVNPDAPPPTDSEDDEPLSSEKLQALYDTIVKLPRADVNILGAIVLQLLGQPIFPGEFAPIPGTAGMAAPAMAEEVVEEAKTQFDIKLIGFDPKAKLKVIKAVRSSLTKDDGSTLGLKEAKELVESAPKVVQKKMKTEAAEELKAELEAVGAVIELV